MVIVLQTAAAFLNVHRNLVLVKCPCDRWQISKTEWSIKKERVCLIITKPHLSLCSLGHWLMTVWEKSEDLWWKQMLSFLCLLLDILPIVMRSHQRKPHSTRLLCIIPSHSVRSSSYHNTPELWRLTLKWWVWDVGGVCIVIVCHLGWGILYEASSTVKVILFRCPLIHFHNTSSHLNRIGSGVLIPIRV